MTLRRRPVRTFLLSAVVSAVAHAAPPIGGADVSALPDIETFGGVFYDRNKADDEIAVLRANGCTLFRVRLFVGPDADPRKNWGATQSLPYVRTLGRRIKAAGGRFLLDLHYSDTWADPAHQAKPKAWADLPFDELERRIGTYTREVINDLQAHDAAPDMVQVGNEITGGLLWPDGRVGTGKDADTAAWQRLTRLLAAGTNAVHAAEKDGRRIEVVLHVHGGGRPGLPQSFFEHLMRNGGDRVDFDVIGLSFYPAWKDDIGDLKTNMAELATRYGKDILLAEVAYAWSPVKGIEGRESMQWPTTPAGQRQFLIDTRNALASVPNGRGLGFVWWYSDSIPVRGLDVWRNGNEALFDHDGRALPALSVLGGHAK